MANRRTAALDTQAPKGAVDHFALTTDWRARADALGFDQDVRRAIVAQAEAAPPA